MAAGVAARGSAGGAACVLEQAASGTVASAGFAIGPPTSCAAILAWRGKIFCAARQSRPGSEDAVPAGGRDVVHAVAGCISDATAPVFRAGGHCHRNDRGWTDAI